MSDWWNMLLEFVAPTDALYFLPSTTQLPHACKVHECSSQWRHTLTEPNWWADPPTRCCQSSQFERRSYRKKILNVNLGWISINKNSYQHGLLDFSLFPQAQQEFRWVIIQKENLPTQSLPLFYSWLNDGQQPCELHLSCLSGENCCWLAKGSGRPTPHHLCQVPHDWSKSHPCQSEQTPA